MFVSVCVYAHELTGNRLFDVLIVVESLFFSYTMCRGRSFCRPRARRPFRTRLDDAYPRPLRSLASLCQAGKKQKTKQKNKNEIKIRRAYFLFIICFFFCVIARPQRFRPRFRDDNIAYAYEPAYSKDIIIVL